VDYDMYKFYKGEAECPKKLSAEQGRLWEAERVFEENFNMNDSSDWYSFFKGCELDGENAGDIFMKKLDSEIEYERPAETSKNWIFNLWVNSYLFVDKFSKEWRKYYK
jgi:hypothetical protein